ncbi:Rod shape-determining protein MreD [Roseivirga pacifica]
MNRSLIRIIFTFALLLPLQVLVFRNFVVFGTGFSFIYLLCLLMLPVEMSVITGMIVALFTGLAVDLFYHTLGIHAAASVFLMFLRYHWLRMNGPRSGYEVNHLPLLSNYGLGWFIGYALPLIFVHSLVVFFVEAGNVALFWQSTFRALITTIISFIFIVISQYFLYPREQ